MTPTIGLLATLTLAGCALLTPGTDLADKIEFAGDTSGVDTASFQNGVYRRQFSEENCLPVAFLPVGRMPPLGRP